MTTPHETPGTVSDAHVFSVAVSPLMIELVALLPSLEWKADTLEYDDGQCHFCMGHRDSPVTILPDSPETYHDVWCPFLKLRALVLALAEK
jgi:hypothetical protein